MQIWQVMQDNHFLILSVNHFVVPLLYLHFLHSYHMKITYIFRADIFFRTKIICVVIISGSRKNVL